MTEEAAKDPMADYVARLKYHDWYYDYSDDGGAYRRGSAQRSELHRLQPQLDPDHKVWNQHAPEDYKHIPEAVRELGDQLLAALDPAQPLDRELVLKLIDDGAYLNAGFRDKDTPLHLAISRGETDIALKLIEKGAGITFRNKAGLGAFHAAAAQDNVQLLHAMIEKGIIDINARDDASNTALMIAAEKGKKAAVEELLLAGAKKDHTNYKRKAALDLARDGGFTEIVRAIEAEPEQLKRMRADARMIEAGLPAGRDVKSAPPVKFKKPGAGNK